MTYAVPAERGPAHVPITPDTDSTPRMRVGVEVVLDQVGDAVGEQPGDVDAARDVDAAQRAAAARPAAAGRAACASRAWAGSGPAAARATAPRPASRASQRSYAAASLEENSLDLRPPPRRVVGQPQVAGRRARGAKYGPCGYTW